MGRTSYVKPLKPPNEEKAGTDWSIEDDINFLRWSMQPQIYRRIINLLFISFSKKGVQLQEADLEDLWSELCMRIHIRVQNYDPNRGNLIPYLIRGLVRNRYKQILRKKCRFEQLDFAYVHGNSDDRKMVDAFHRKEKLNHLCYLLRNAVSPEERNLIAQYLQGKKAREISSVEGISIELVRTRIHRIKHKLREAWLARNRKRVVQ